MIFPQKFYAKVKRVIDGDTCEVSWGHKMGIAFAVLRLRGINAPELRPRKGTQAERVEEKKRARRAKARAEELLLEKEVLVTIFGYGKWSPRWIADIFLPEEGKGFQDIMVSEGLAERREYN